VLEQVRPKAILLLGRKAKLAMGDEADTRLAKKFPDFQPPKDVKAWLDGLLERWAAGQLLADTVAKGFCRPRCARLIRLRARQRNFDSLHP
jgi:hypothetical protein